MWKTLPSMLVTVIVLSTMVGGLVADFSDIETSPDNTLVSGSLDLKVNDNDEPNITAFSIADVIPCKNYVYTIVLRNAGTLDGMAYMCLLNCEGIEDEPGPGIATSEPELVAEEGGKVGPRQVIGLGVDTANIFDYIDIAIEVDSLPLDIFKYDDNRNGNVELSELAGKDIELGQFDADSTHKVQLTLHLQNVTDRAWPCDPYFKDWITNAYQGDICKFNILWQLWQLPLPQAIAGPADPPPEPLIYSPEYGGWVSGTVEVAAVEYNLAEDVVSAAFEYSRDGSIWTRIAVDNLPEDGFAVEWDTSGVIEGRYFLRAIMTDTSGKTGEDRIPVYVDPTPPIPIIYAPLEDETVSGVIEFKVSTTDEDVVCLLLEYTENCTKLVENITDGRRVLSKAAHLGRLSTDNVDWDGGSKTPPDWWDWCTTPTAFINCLKYFEQDYRDVLWPNIADAAKDMGKHMGTKPGKGTPEPQVLPGLQKYLRQRKIKCLTWHKEEKGFVTFANMKKQFLKCENVILDLFYKDENCTKENELRRLTMTLSEMSWKQVGKKETEPKIKVINPEHGGESTSCNWTDKENWYPILAEPGTGKWWGVKRMYIISPCDEKKKENKTLKSIGSDKDGSNGWSVSWDTRTATNGLHVVDAIMIDAAGNRATTSILVYVQNSP